MFTNNSYYSNIDIYYIITEVFYGTFAKYSAIFHILNVCLTKNVVQSYFFRRPKYARQMVKGSNQNSLTHNRMAACRVLCVHIVMNLLLSHGGVRSSVKTGNFVNPAIPGKLFLRMRAHCIFCLLE